MKTTRILSLAMTMVMGMIAGLQASVTEHQPPAPLPEFKTPAQLAKWRAEQSQKSQPSASTQEGGVFYTGKPYLAESGSYAFKYRQYSPDMARWTTVDPSGFPDGPNNILYLKNGPIEYIDNDGLSGVLIISSSSDGSSSLSISGHSWIRYTPDGGQATTYGTWGNNPNNLGNGLHQNLELSRTDGVSMSQHIDNTAEANLINVVNNYKNRGADAWSASAPCSTFAADAWNAATGQHLSPGLISTPYSLMINIQYALE
jgi:RHS repeat-associated protein